MNECPECGMRDDDWFLCRRDKCPIGVKSGVAAEIANLQEQVETLEADVAFFRGQFNDQVESREAAEAERDRLRALLEDRDKFIVDQGLWAAFVASLRAALQKEPQP